MSQAKSRRGRPKGTGIDDSDRIAQLTELLKVRPELKPTTAIRTMGISNPSVIRRLRDKYHEAVHACASETRRLRPTPPPATPQAVRPAAGPGKTGDAIGH